MRPVVVRDLLPGHIVARPIYTDRGEILLNAGSELNDRYIRMLENRGVISVFVKDPGEAVEVVEDIVTARVRTAALGSVRKMFDVAKRATQDLQGKSAREIISALNDPGRQSQSAPGDAAIYDEFYSSVEKIVEEVIRADTLTGLASLKTHDNYTFCHSVDMTITALLLGHKLFLTRDQLKILGIGCMLHDIGKIFIDAHVLTKPESLSAQEYELIKQHPRTGFDLLKVQMPKDVLPKHVALQHHERQDGTGYPRGIKGYNKVGRSDAQRFDAEHMMLLAEIAAVADVYDALASDRPYRLALPAEEIVDVLRQSRGKHLNAEVLDAFLNVFPSYPAGMDVVVTKGPYAGFRGQVSAINKESVGRPKIRLSQDRAGARLWPPVEVNLAEETSTYITAAAYKAGVN